MIKIVLIFLGTFPDASAVKKESETADNANIRGR